jgi:DNA-binding MarR family transcriptional regulator
LASNFTDKARAIITLNDWCRANLPTDGSPIAHELSLHIVMRFDSNPTLGLKQLYSTVPYSEPQLRRHLRRLEQENWVLVRADPVDARNRHVLPTEKMLDAYANYFSLFHSVAEKLDED